MPRQYYTALTFICINTITATLPRATTWSFLSELLNHISCPTLAPYDLLKKQATRRQVWIFFFLSFYPVCMLLMVQYSSISLLLLMSKGNTIPKLWALAPEAQSGQVGTPKLIDTVILGSELVKIIITVMHLLNML